jgi:hypothetical protein
MTYYQQNYDKWNYTLFVPCLYPSLYEPYDTHYMQYWNKTFEYYQSAYVMHNSKTDYQLNTLCDHVLGDSSNETMFYTENVNESGKEIAMGGDFPNSTSPKPKFIAPRFEKKWLENHNYQQQPLQQHQYQQQQQQHFQSSEQNVIKHSPATQLNHQMSSKYTTSAPMSIVHKPKQPQSLSTSSGSSTSSSGYGSSLGPSPPTSPPTTNNFNSKKKRNHHHHYYGSNNRNGQNQNSSSHNKRCKCCYNYNCNCAPTSMTANKYRIANVQRSRN